MAPAQRALARPRASWPSGRRATSRSSARSSPGPRCRSPRSSSSNAGPVEISAIRSAELIAGLIVGLFAGAWVDRLRRRPILIWADLGRARPARVDPARVRLQRAVPAAALSRGLRRGGPVDVLRRRRQRLPADRRPARAARRGQQRPHGDGLGGRVQRVRHRRLPDRGLHGARSRSPSTRSRSSSRPSSWARSASRSRRRRRVADREPVLREIRDGMRIVARSPVLRALALSHGGTHILWGIFGTSYLLFANEELDLGPAAVRRHRRGAAASARSPARRSPRAWFAGSGSARRSCSAWSASSIGNALIPLAPAGRGGGRCRCSAALFLIAQQLLGDSLATVYEITEVSLVQASVGDRVLGRVNATIGDVHHAAHARSARSPAGSSPRPGACEPRSRSACSVACSRSSSSGSRPSATSAMRRSSRTSACPATRCRSPSRHRPGSRG